MFIYYSPVWSITNIIRYSIIEELFESCCNQEKSYDSLTSDLPRVCGVGFERGVEEFVNAKCLCQCCKFGSINKVCYKILNKEYSIQWVMNYYIIKYDSEEYWKIIIRTLKIKFVTRNSILKDC